MEIVVKEYEDLVKKLTGRVLGYEKGAVRNVEQINGIIES